MTPAELKEAVKEAIEEERQNFWVPAEEHWRHHEQLRMCVQSKPEWEENHRFVSDFRRSAGKAKSTGITVIIGALVAYLIYKIFGWKI